MKSLLIIALSIWAIAFIIFFFRNRIRKALLRWQVKLQLGSIRTAIGDADENKFNTGRKNLVIFNLNNKRFEPVQKKVLKHNVKAKKQKRVPNGWKIPKSYKVNKKLTFERTKKIEEKSIYTTS